MFEDRQTLEEFRANPRSVDPALDRHFPSAALTDRVDELHLGALRYCFDRPIFILSAPRAGSTLLFDLLVLCRGLWSVGREMQDMIDGHPALNIVRRGFNSHAVNETDADFETATCLLACLLADLHTPDGVQYLDRAPGGQPFRFRFIDKTPENALRIPFLRRIFPDARFVFLHRDVKQNISSMVEAWQHAGFISVPELPGFPRRHWCFLLPEGWRRHRYASLSELAAFQWHSSNRAIIHELEAIPRQQWTTLSYADLVADPAAQVERLLDFLELEAGPELNRALEANLPLSPTTVTPPSPLKWKSNRCFDARVVKRLQPLAGRIRNLHVHDAPPVLRSHYRTSTRFARFVDELAPCSAPDKVVVAPSLRAQPGTSVPLDLLRKVRHRERFLPEYPLLWIEDPATGIWCPLWLRHHQAWLCSSLAPAQRPPSMLTGCLRDQLCSAGVLTTLEAVAERQCEGTYLRTKAREALGRDSYTRLPRLLDPVLTNAVAQYYKSMISSGEWPLGDAQVERRHGWHNERISQFLHGQLTEVLSDIADRPLKPTYSFASAYRGGAQLEAHTDREQCDFTLSLMIAETAPSSAPPWSLWFQAPRGQQKVDLAVSDGVFFRGCDLPHWRGVASPQHEQINLLFHFAPSEWKGVLD